MTILYGRNTLSADPDPEDNQAAVSWAAGPTYSPPYKMQNAAGASLITMTKTLAMTFNTVANSYYWKGTCWMSNALSAGTISAGTLTLKIWARSEAIWNTSYTHTVSPAFTAFIWDKVTDTRKSWLLGGSPAYGSGTIVDTTYREYTISGACTSQAVANGDRIGIDVIWYGQTYAFSPDPGLVQSLKCSMRWGDATYQSNLTIPGTIPPDFVGVVPGRMLLGMGV